MSTHRVRDTAHHHPRVRRAGARWVWECRCGGASCRTARDARPWREVVTEALLHSASLAP